MRILAVDDEKYALENMLDVLDQVVPDAEVVGFQNAQKAYEYIQENECQIAFLDIEMREMNGVALAKKIKIISPKTNIIFSTGYADYTGEAFQLHASGYLLKPVTPQAVRDEFAELRYPVKLMGQQRVRVQTFGNFEVFVEDELLNFKYTKTKEMLAYLVDRKGALCTNGEIMGVLWEDEANPDKKSSYLKNLRHDLVYTCEEARCAFILEKQWGKLGVRTDKFQCDLYDWIEGKAEAVKAYNGEYMAQYSWAEYSMNDFLK